MMKKYILSAITTSLLLTLSACDDGDNGSDGINTLITQTQLPLEIKTVEIAVCKLILAWILIKMQF